MKLLIVESPAKCKKIVSFLGKEFVVKATMGHFVEIKDHLKGIDWTTFDIRYAVLRNKQGTLRQLRDLCQKAETVYLATDPDREGEAISFHLCQFLHLPLGTTPRIRFHEITKEAVTRAVANPSLINMNLVRAQQARQILDLFLGFRISPFLWKSIAPRLSAGRCQSPALRMVLDREQALHDVSQLDRRYRVRFDFLDGIEHARLVPDLETLQDCKLFLRSMKKTNDYVLARVDLIERSQQPPAPFITSTLQQEPHGLGAKQCMSVLQSLYEKGKITYMRTDNPALSPAAMEDCRVLIIEKWTEDYYQQRVFSSKSSSQDAHEAIRPTKLSLEELPEGFSPIEKKMYQRIWKRTVASQMTSFRWKEQTAIIQAGAGYVFEHKTTETIHHGWKLLYPSEQETKVLNLPLHKIPMKLFFQRGKVQEEFERLGTRHSEATLIRELESQGIGRPSTFHYLCETLTKRNYASIGNVEGISLNKKIIHVAHDYQCSLTEEACVLGKETKKFIMTDLGCRVVDYLKTAFPLIMEYPFTKHMEHDLDTIATDGSLYQPILQKHITTLGPLFDQETARLGKVVNPSTTKNKKIGNRKEKLKILMEK